MMGIMTKERNGKLYATDMRFCIDNGAMIAQAGYEMYKSDPACALAIKETSCTQRFRTDEVDITWRD